MKPVDTDIVEALGVSRHGVEHLVPVVGREVSDDVRITIGVRDRDSPTH